MLYPLLFGGRVYLRPRSSVWQKGDMYVRVTLGAQVTITALRSFTFGYRGKEYRVRRGRAIQIPFTDMVFIRESMHHNWTQEIQVLPRLPYTSEDTPWKWSSLDDYVKTLPEHLRQRVFITASRAIWTTKEYQANFQKWVLTVCMVMHARLGETSPWKNIPEEIVRMIRDCL